MTRYLTWCHLTQTAGLYELLRAPALVGSLGAGPIVGAAPNALLQRPVIAQSRLPSAPAKTSRLSGQNSRLGVPPGGSWSCPGGAGCNGVARLNVWHLGESEG
jgi:hypothetical protein